MKLSAIKRCCAETKWAEVVTDTWGCQWISNLAGMWNVVGLRIDAESIKELFDLNEKQAAKWRITEREVKDRRVCAGEREEDIELKEIGRVMLGDEVLLLLSGAEGLVMINQMYVKPTRAEYRRYFLRTHPEHNPMVAVFEDMLCSALIMPVSAYGNRSLQEMAEAIVYGKWAVADSEQAADAEVAAERVAASMGINCDTERGME